MYWEGGGGESRCWEFLYRVCTICGRPIIYSRNGEVDRKTADLRGFQVIEVTHPTSRDNPHFEQWAAILENES